MTEEVEIFSSAERKEHIVVALEISQTLLEQLKFYLLYFVKFQSLEFTCGRAL